MKRQIKKKSLVKRTLAWSLGIVVFFLLVNVGVMFYQEKYNPRFEFFMYQQKMDNSQALVLEKKAFANMEECLVEYNKIKVIAKGTKVVCGKNCVFEKDKDQIVYKQGCSEAHNKG